MQLNQNILSIFTLIFCLLIVIDAKTKCVRATGQVTCPTDKHAASNVEVRLLDEDSLPWETDDLMGHNYTDESGHYVVEGCGDDMFSWNDPDPKIEVRHRCPEPGHTVSISFRIKEIEIPAKYLPEDEVHVENIRLDI